MSWLVPLFLVLGAVQVGKASAEEEPSPSSVVRSYDELPPSPGPLPAQFVDVQAYEDTLHARLHDITLRQAGLSELGRPPTARRWRLTGWLTAGAGLTVGMVAYLVALDTVEDRPFRTFLATGIVGGLVCLTGFTILLAAPRNPYRREIRALQRAGKQIESELQRLKWERASPQLVVSERGVMLTMPF